VQAALERGVDDMIVFAGDNVGEWTHMESAARRCAGLQPHGQTTALADASTDASRLRRR
jgi:hypothetical protein